MVLPGRGTAWRKSGMGGNPMPTQQCAAASVPGITHHKAHCSYEWYV